MSAPGALLAGALDWSAHCRVVPCHGKNPGGYLGRGWQQQASRNEAQLRDWWSRWPGANVGIVAGRDLLPVDVDDPDEFERFQRDHGVAPPTPRCYTNGVPGVLRERLIFQHPDVELHDQLCPGVQLRDGERVSIVPPSVNPMTGAAYEWRDAVDEVPIAPLPGAWLELSRKHTTVTGCSPRRASDWRRLANGVVDGNVSGREGRKRATCRLAGYLFARRVDVHVVLELLVSWDQRNTPPLGREEVERVVDWVAEQEVRKWAKA
jgi:hypothetical protein